MTQKWKTNQTTSNIYKLYINGKPKRQETQQCPYLGPKVVVVAEKLDPTVDQICFLRIFQTKLNLKKKTTGMSSEGPKMRGGRYGSAWNGRKTTKSDDPRLRPPPHSPAREILATRSPHCAPPPWLARVSKGWPETSPTAKTRLA